MFRNILLGMVLCVLPIEAAEIAGLRVDVAGESDLPVATIHVALDDIEEQDSLRVSVDVLAEDGALIKEVEQDVLQRVGQRVFAVVQVPLDAEMLWYPERPLRYRIRARVFDGRQQLAVREETHVFRWFGVTENQFVLNGITAGVHARVYEATSDTMGIIQDTFRELRRKHYTMVVMPPGSINETVVAHAEEIGLMVSVLNEPAGDVAGTLGWVDPRKRVFHFGAGGNTLPLAENPQNPFDHSLTIADPAMRKVHIYKSIAPIQFDQEKIVVDEDDRLVEVSIANHFLVRSLGEFRCIWNWRAGKGIVDSGDQRVFLEAGQRMTAAFPLPEDGFSNALYTLSIRFLDVEDHIAGEIIPVQHPAWKRALLLMQQGLLFDEDWQVRVTALEAINEHRDFIFRYRLDEASVFCMTRERNIRLLDGPLQFSFGDSSAQASRWVHIEKESVPGEEQSEVSSLLRGFSEDGEPTQEFVQLDWRSSPFGYMDFRVQNRMAGESANDRVGISLQMPAHLKWVRVPEFGKNIPNTYDIQANGKELEDVHYCVILDERGYGLVLFGWGIDVAFRSNERGAQVTITLPAAEEPGDSVESLASKRSEPLRFRIIPFTPETRMIDVLVRPSL